MVDWIKYTDRQPSDKDPHWLYLDGNVSVQILPLSVSDKNKEKAMWMPLEYPQPPRDKNQYSKWDAKNTG